MWMRAVLLPDLINVAARGLPAARTMRLTSTPEASSVMRLEEVRCRCMS